MSDTPPALPSFTSWPTFPFEGDLHVRKLDDPVSEEPPRHGEDPSECRACQAPDEAYIWVSERWRVRSLDRPTGLPMVVILESRSHFDLGDLTNMLAAELGVLTVRLERAVRSLDGVARVHVNRWGDGSAHLHLWFMARPLGRLQLRGTFLSLWDEILAPIPEAQWRENLALIAAWLEEFGGRALAEPPRIDWQAPAHLADLPLPVVDEEEEHVAPAGEVAEPHATAEPVPEDDGPDAPGPEAAHPGVPSDGPEPATGTDEAVADEPVAQEPAGTPPPAQDGVTDDLEPDDSEDTDDEPAADADDDRDATPASPIDGIARVAIPAQARPAADDGAPVPVPVGAPDDDSDDPLASDEASMANRSGRPVRGSRKRRLRRR